MRSSIQGRVCIYTYIDIYVHHTYIHTNVDTYIHTYIHTQTCIYILLLDQSNYPRIQLGQSLTWSIALEGCSRGLRTPWSWRVWHAGDRRPSLRCWRAFRHKHAGYTQRTETHRQPTTGGQQKQGIMQHSQIDTISKLVSPTCVNHSGSSVCARA
jgi:hypothetical protein